MKRIGMFLVCAIGCLGITSISSAEYMSYDGLANWQAITIHYAPSPANGMNVAAGTEKVTFRGTQYNVFCVDLMQWAASGNDFTQVPLSSIANGDKLAYLWETYNKPGISSLEAAAIGMSVWEIRFETSGAYNVTNGTVSMTGNDPVANRANQMLASIPTNYTPKFGKYEFVLTSPTNQDFMGSSVPEPATLGLLAAGGIGLLVRRNRRKLAA